MNFPGHPGSMAESDHSAALKCPRCHVYKAAWDTHETCRKCKQCREDSRCEVCLLWPAEKFISYREAKRRARVNALVGRGHQAAAFRAPPSHARAALDQESGSSASSEWAAEQIAASARSSCSSRSVVSGCCYSDVSSAAEEEDSSASENDLSGLTQEVQRVDSEVS